MLRSHAAVSPSGGEPAVAALAIQVHPSTSWLTQLRYICACLGLEAVMTNEVGSTTLDCSQGMDPSLLRLTQAALPNLTAGRNIINNLQNRSQGGACLHCLYCLYRLYCLYISNIHHKLGSCCWDS